jgi:hypothetical protein
MITREPFGLAENLTKFFVARGEMPKANPLMRKGRSAKSGEAASEKPQV